MRKRRILSALLALVLTAALILPASAAGGSFADVSDPDTAVAADVLRLMGVVGGVGGNRFHPEGGLTRAEFCTMAVNFMQRGKEAANYASRTIFRDVTARHWALGYVNLAASIKISDGENNYPLIAGIGDGRFAPDNRIDTAQAVTILLRVLGYSSEQIGALWPQSYMLRAKSIGLLDGLDAASGTLLTRAQAAQLFLNALRCKTGNGEVYYKTLGSCVDDVIILALNVAAGDGSSNSAIRTSADADPYLAAVGEVSPAALVGKRGSLILNDRQQIVTFVPDDSTATVITLSGDAMPTYVKDTGGQRYTVPSGAVVYTSGDEEGSAYRSAYSGLKAGMQLTMYSEQGKIAAIYAAGSTGAGGSGAVVVMGKPSTAMFHQLTGGAVDFTVQKNQTRLELSQLSEYDVVTYDRLNRVLIASDLRLKCVYEDAQPNAKTPETITALGHTFEVLESAWDMTQGIRIGDDVTLLLTADGRVAGILPGTRTASTAVGMVTAQGVQMYLPAGGSVLLTGTVSNAERLSQQLVTVSSGKKGSMTVSQRGFEPGGEFRVDAMMLGDSPVANGVRIYEQVNGGAMIPVNLSELAGMVIASDKVALCHRNGSGLVDYVVLEEVTGNAYTYGILKKGEPQVGGAGGFQYENDTILVENAAGTAGPYISAYTFVEDSFGGVAAGVNGRAAGLVAMKKLEHVSPEDFFVSQGEAYVTAGGQVWKIWDGVECYKTVTGVWFKGESAQERLAACKAFSDELTVYVDPIGEKVRIIAAN